MMRQIAEAWLDNDQKFYDYRTRPIDGINIFDEQVASNSWAGNFLTDPEYMKTSKNMVMHIAQMTPTEYWEACARDVFHKPVATLLHQWRTLDEKTLEHLKQVIQIYKRRFPITYINYAKHDGADQEGLHRMIVAGDLYGWDTKFPVMIIEWADKDRANSEKQAIRANKVRNYINSAINQALRYKYSNIDELKSQLEDELRDELKYDSEFEDSAIEVQLIRTADQAGYEIILNDKYRDCYIFDEDIQFIDYIDFDDTMDDSFLDDIDDSFIDDIELDDLLS